MKYGYADWSELSLTAQCIRQLLSCSDGNIVELKDQNYVLVSWSNSFLFSQIMKKRELEVYHLGLPSQYQQAAQQELFGAF